MKTKIIFTLASEKQSPGNTLIGNLWNLYSKKIHKLHKYIAVYNDF